MPFSKGLLCILYDICMIALLYKIIMQYVLPCANRLALTCYIECVMVERRVS